jgi:hypothetical protein
LPGPALVAVRVALDVGDDEHIHVAAASHRVLGLGAEEHDALRAKARFRHWTSVPRTGGFSA